jgi:hypothetical protein
MKRVVYILLVIGLAMSACRLSATPTSTPLDSGANPIPSEFQATYDNLGDSLDKFIASLPQQTGGQSPIFAAELASANGNIGEGLLRRPEALTLVRQELDALSDIGVQGVVVAIKFPLLEPGFPRSTDYLQFYIQVATEIRQRGMKFLVEVGPVFSGTIYSPLDVDWSEYTEKSFLGAQQAELVVIATEIQPDYLQIANEPTTIETLTGFEINPDEYADFVQSTVQELGSLNGIILGAGAGTWEDPEYMEALMTIQGLDSINIHIFPIGRDGNLLQVAYETAQQAYTNGKRVVVSQSGLYKINSAELNELGTETATIYRRDAYSFFEPLDEKFIVALTLMSKAGDIEFIPLFWTRNFFAYLDYQEVRTWSDTQVNRGMNQAFITALENGTLSPLGEFFKNWIDEQNR